MIFDILAIAFVVLFSLYMMKKGGIKAILSLASLALAVIIGAMCYPVLTEAVYATDLPKGVEEAVEKSIREKGEEAGLEAIDAMPDFVRNSITIDEEAALEKVLDDVSDEIARLVINVINFVLVVIVTKIILAFLISFLNITAKLPVIRQIDQVIGLGCGIVISFTMLWLAVAAAGVAAASNVTVANAIEGSHAVSIMSNIAPF